MSACAVGGCKKEARCAIRTRRATRPNLMTTIYYDDRVAPKTALRYCRTCAIRLMRDMIITLVDEQ
jgi:hypothetical protein